MDPIAPLPARRSGAAKRTVICARLRRCRPVGGACAQAAELA
ncbi:MULTISPECIES: hypothetical protein [Stenotrophomonas]|nr:MULTISPECIES: hypothetical protein [Stenotrophomonas]MDQ7273039.1 hypothetical protein [Stenotrophomonas sp. Sm3212]MDT3455633.1 hypothetical protein [Stenotrophomonas pavanii]MDT3465816.1 hypothetical protein [Stenotrophomonas pavanii]